MGVGDVGSEEIMLGDGVESSVSSSDNQAVQLSRHLDVLVDWVDQHIGL